jgi:hypothetical protein
MATHEITHGATGNYIEVTCTDADGGTPDFSSGTFQIEVFRKGKRTSVVLDSAPTAVSPAATSGKLRYTFVSGDWDTIPNETEEYHVIWWHTSGGVVTPYPGGGYDTLEVTADPSGTPADVSSVSYVSTAVAAATYYPIRVFDVKLYGADGDGTTDDTTAISAAYTAAVAAGGGIIYFPAGTYIVAGAASNSTIFTVSASNITFRGAGRKVSYIKPSTAMGAGHTVFAVGAVSRVVFEDLGLTKASAAASSKAISFAASDNCTVHRTFVDSQFGWSVFVGSDSQRTVIRELESAGSSSNNIEINASSYTLVDGCDITGVTGNGVELYENGGSIVGNSVQNCWIHGTPSLGVGSFGTTDTIVEGNIIEGATTAGVYATNSEVTPATSGSGLIIRGNRIRSTASGASGGIYVVNAYSGGVGPTDVVIESNHVTASGGSVAGINVQGTGAMRATIQGNVSNLNGGTGINVDGVRASVIGNVVMNNSQVGVGTFNGISVGAGAATSNTIVIGNDCSDTQGTHTQQFGVYIGASSTDAVVIGNKAIGTTNLGVYDVGTRTVRQHNRQDFASASLIPNVFAAPTVQLRTTITYSASMTPNAWNGNEFVITATNANAFTINDPTGGTSTTGQRITIRIKNTSGGALGAATWGAGYKMAAWTNPATGNSRAIDFQYDGASWVEVSRTTADVPN